MSAEHQASPPSDPRIRAAVAELEELIRRRYPEATFDVGQGHDPEGVYLTPTVDVEDTDAVFDIVVDRLLELQIDDELPVYVIPVRPIERVMAELRARPKVRSAAGHGRLEALGLPDVVP